MDLSTLARYEIRNLQVCPHGGELPSSRDVGSNSKEIIDFSANINPLGPPPSVREAFDEAFLEVGLYPDSRANGLRRALGRYLGVGAGQVIVGSGSVELIYLFADAFSGARDRALIPIPTFGEYERAVARRGGEILFVPMGRDFRVPMGEVIRNLGRGVKAVFLCNPNNPTSQVVGKEELIKLLEICLKRGVLLFLDEDCIEFVEESKHFSLLSYLGEYKNLFILRSFSKLFGLAGLRVGYGIASSEMVELLEKARMPWSVNCVAQKVAEAALRDRGFVEKTRRFMAEERPFLAEELKKIEGVKVYEPEANFVLMDIRGTGFTSAQCKERMLKQGLLIRDCSSFRGLDEYHIRVAVRKRPDNEKLIEALSKTLRGGGE